MKTLSFMLLLLTTTVAFSQSFYYRDDFTTGNDTNWSTQYLGTSVGIHQGIAHVYSYAIVPATGSATEGGSAMYQPLAIQAGKIYKLKLNYRYYVTSYTNVNNSTIDMKTIIWAGNTPIVYNAPNVPADPGGQHVSTHYGNNFVWGEREVYFTANNNYSFLGVYTSMPFVGQLSQYASPGATRSAYGHFQMEYIELCEVLPIPNLLPTDHIFFFCTNSAQPQMLSTNAAASSYRWEYKNANGTITVEPETSASIAVTKAGFYRVSAVNANGCASEPSAWKETYALTPPKPVIYGPAKVCPPPYYTTLYTNSNPYYVAYQWYSDEVLMPGEVNPTLDVNAGYYYVSVKVLAITHPAPDTYCWVNSARKKLGIEFNLSLCNASLMSADADATKNKSKLEMYPSPANDALTITGMPDTGKSRRIIIYDRDQNVVFTSVVESTEASAVIETSAMREGIYYLVIESNQLRSSERFSIKH
jgi:hypothetical protein